MYAIANIIYGYPMTRGKLAEAVGEGSFDQIDSDGYLSYYSGNIDPSPAAFGIVIGEFNECTDFIPITDITPEPTQEQIQQFNSYMDELPIAASDMLRAEGDPFTFILWSTS